MKFQFRLRSLIIVVTLVCVWLGMISGTGSSIFISAAVLFSISAVAFTGALFLRRIKARQKAFCVGALVSLITLLGFTWMRHLELRQLYDENPEVFHEWTLGRNDQILLAWGVAVFFFPFVVGVGGFVTWLVFWLFTDAKQLADRELEKSRSE